MADRSFKETPKSSRVDKKNPSAARVDTNAIRLLIVLFGNSGNPESEEEFVFWLLLFLTGSTEPGLPRGISCTKIQQTMESENVNSHESMMNKFLTLKPNN